MILESGSLAVLAEVSFFFIPFMRRQKDNLLLAALEPFFNLDGSLVTAVFSLEPGFSLLYDSTPFLFKPPDSLLPSFLCHAGVPSSSSTSSLTPALRYPPPGDGSTGTKCLRILLG